MIDKVKRLGKETLIYGTSTIVARLFNFFLVPVYTYYLATSQYGVIATVFAFMALFNIVYQYGMDQAYLRFAQDHKDKNVFSTPFNAVLMTSVALSLIIYTLSPYIAAALGIGRENAYLIKYCCFILALDALNIIPFAKLRFEHRAWHFVIIRTVSIMVNVAGNLLALACFKAGVDGIFMAGIAASLASLILLLPVIKEDFKLAFDTKLFKAMFAFSWPFIPAGMASIMVNVIDKPLLSHLAGLSEVGIYQANFKIGVFMMLAVSMFDQAWRPFFIQASAKPDCKELFAEIFTYFAAAASWLFLGLSLLIPTIIQTKFLGFNLIHESYWSGLNIIPLVLAGYLFYGFYINFMVAPVLTKKTKVLMFITLAGAAASVITNIILVPVIGIVGAGWAIFVSYVVMALALFIFLQRNYPVNYHYKKLSLMACAALLVLMGNMFAGQMPPIHALILRIIMLCIYPVLALLIILKVKTRKELSAQN